MVRPNTDADFWQKVDSSGGPDSCWPWLAFRTPKQGRCSWRGKVVAAHTVAYRLQRGDVPARTNISHTCGDAFCCNPAHLLAFRKTGPKEAEARARARLLDGIEKTEHGCWLYAGYKTPTGYGLIAFQDKTTSAHRLMWRLTFGAIPKGQHVRHRCDVPSCVNPDHLLLGSHSDNMADRKERGRYQRAGVRLTAEQVAEIRVSTESTSSLSKKYGVRYGTIQGIRTGQTWKRQAAESSSCGGS